MPRPKEFEREEVLTRAMEVFWKHGYQATSMQQLVEHMGINRFSIYNSFGCKHSLFVDALRSYSQNIKEHFLLPLLEAEEGRKAIEGFYESLIAAGEQGEFDGCLLVNTISELGSFEKEETPAIHDCCMDYLRLLEHAFKAALQRAQELGEIDKCADTSAYAKILVQFTSGLASTGKMFQPHELRYTVNTFLSRIL